MMSFSRLAALLLGAWTIVTVAPTAFAQDDAAGQAQPRGTVEGHIEGSTAADLPVVLLQFRLNDQGQPEGGPIGRTATKEGGTYRFTDVPIDSRTVYRLGTRLNGRLIGSDPFTFQKGQTHVEFNLRIPAVQTDTSVLDARELLWVAEPRPGGLWVTEVLHLENPSKDEVDLAHTPLEMPIPSEARDLEMLQLDLENADHDQLGPKLLITGLVPPGIAVVAFRYHVPAPLGTVRWERRYPFPIASLRVLSPNGAVRAAGDGLEPQPDETYDKVSYTVWKREALAPETAMHVRFSGLPISQSLLLWPLAGFVLLMAAVVAWFVRRRLSRGGGPPQASTASAGT